MSPLLILTVPGVGWGLFPAWDVALYATVLALVVALRRLGVTG